MLVLFKQWNWIEKKKFARKIDSSSKKRSSAWKTVPKPSKKKVRRDPWWEPMIYHSMEIKAILISIIDSIFFWLYFKKSFLHIWHRIVQYKHKQILLHQKIIRSNFFVVVENIIFTNAFELYWWVSNVSMLKFLPYLCQYVQVNFRDFCIHEMR